MHRPIEILEARIAPAAVFTYTEADGDKVTVKTSAKISAEDFESLASFDEGNLSELILDDPIFQNTNLTITVKKAGGGDGKASIGHIQAGVDLKNVIIKGNLESIRVGDMNASTASINKLQVQDLGASVFKGDNKEIKVLGNLIGYLEVADRVKTLSIAGSVMTGVVIEADDIGSLVIGGDMGGYISVDKVIGSLRIAGDVHSEFGNGGSIYADAIKSISIGKSIIGNENDGSRIQVRTIGKLVVGGDVIGGEHNASGQINATEIGAVTIKGDVIGGPGLSSGQINGFKVGTIRVGGNLEGGSGENSGNVRADEGGSIKKIVVGGSIIGSTGISSGVISATDIASATIGKSIVGGDGQYSASVQSLSLESIAIGKHLTGGSGTYSGIVRSIEGIGSLRIGGDLQGGSGERSGWVNTVEAGSVDKVVINGSIIGGAGIYSGNLEVDYIVSGSIGRSVLGGTGEYSGGLFTSGIAKVSVGKDVIGGSGPNSGSINGYSGIQSVKIGKNLAGDAFGSGTVRSFAGSIGSVSIGGSLSNIDGNFSGIFAHQSIGSVTIGGDATGSEYGEFGIYAGFSHPANSAVPAIGSVKIKGSVTNFQIGAGSGFFLATASIGSVNIGGDFKTSSIVAGALAGADGFFGTADDSVSSSTDLVSRIASVVIRKSVIGTPDIADDSYGIFAQHIVSLKVKGAKQTLETGAANDLDGKLLGGTDDVRYVELPIAMPA